MWRIVVTLAALGVGLVACQPADPSGDVGPGPADPGAPTVTMHDNEFEPETLELPAGEEVTVEVRNEGSTVHDFTIDDVELSTGGVDPDEVMTATFVVPEGSTEYRCTIHAGMSGELVGVR